VIDTNDTVADVEWIGDEWINREAGDAIEAYMQGTSSSPRRR
jgi:hypothetical protein